MPGGKCLFNDDWFKSDDYKNWILRDSESKCKARCAMCSKSFDVSNMGECALKYHMKGKKHQKIVNSRYSGHTLNMHFSANNQRPSCSQEVIEPDKIIAESTTSSSLMMQQSVDMNNLCLKAEILWCLKMLDSHYSYKSCENVGEIFRCMFNDSSIAKNFSCGEKKAAYLSCFGIAPYFSSLLKTRVKEADGYVLLFDESMNSMNQLKQMDCHLRFWHHDKVVTRYFSSDFLGHSTANVLFEKINEKCISMGLDKLIQISMDGPNVNLKVMDNMLLLLKKEHAIGLLNVGTCGLHVMHNAFRAGCSVFPEVENTLIASYRLFKDSPARRDDYSSLKMNIKFPLKFCKQRWLENVAPIERLLDILEDLNLYVKEISEKKFTSPKCASFETVKAALMDDLFPAKCYFVLSIAREIEPFLQTYQNDKPMIPFLGADLYNLLINGLMQKFIIDKSIKSLSSPLKLLDVDVNDKKIHKDVSKINVGFSAKRVINSLNKENFNTERKIMEFYNNCKEFYIIVVKKLLEKCPLNYGLVRNMSCFNPNTLISEKDINLKKLHNVLLTLVNAKRISEIDCDIVIKEYSDFISELKSMDSATRFRSCSGLKFDPVNDRLDVFYYDFLSEQPKYSKLWQVLKTLLLLSHGQASVERGFSINKNLIVDNLGDQSIIAKRIIKDHLQFIGGIKNVVYPKEFLVSAAGARQKYISYLDEQKRKNVKDMQLAKRKEIEDKIDDLKKKKRCLEIDVNGLNKTAEDYAERAEKESNLTFISKSNALRRHAREKYEELKKCEITINDMANELNSS